jgi:CRISPR-associated endoribonuclease Cas6
MRFRLILSVNRSNNSSGILPINYQYELSSWIYKTINKSDGKFSHWLHDTGYTRQNRKFKLFTFSNLYPEKYKVEGDRLKLLSDQVSLVASFYLPAAVEHFITGLFRAQEFSLGDTVSSVDFGVSRIEKLPEVDFGKEMKFRTVSPVVISISESGESRHARYLSPLEEQYSDLLAGNLVNKYIALAEGGIEVLKGTGVDHEVALKVLGQPRQKLIKIKAGTAEQVFLKGYLFDFMLRAPAELMRIGYYGGFGEKNSLGFGCCEISKT